MSVGRIFHQFNVCLMSNIISFSHGSRKRVFQQCYRTIPRCCECLHSLFSVLFFFSRPQVWFLIPQGKKQPINSYYFNCFYTRISKAIINFRSFGALGLGTVPITYLMNSNTSTIAISLVDGSVKQINGLVLFIKRS